jgi:hypothetical protein
MKCVKIDIPIGLPKDVETSERSPALGVLVHSNSQAFSGIGGSSERGVDVEKAQANVRGG